MINQVLNFWTKIKNAYDIDRQRGISIFLAVIMLTLVLSIALGVNTLLISQIKTMRDSGNSVIAFYGAESGTEWALMNVNDSNWQTTVYHNYLDLNGDHIEEAAIDAIYDVTTIAPGVGQCAATADYCIKSVGVYRGTRRVIQIQL